MERKRSRGKLFLNVKLACLFAPTFGLALVHETPIETNRVVLEAQDVNKDDKLDCLHIEDAIASYALEEIKNDHMYNSKYCSSVDEMVEERVLKEIKKENLKEESEKEKVLNNFKKCNTLDDIHKRQKELESLNLTDDDKIYKNCKASAEIQHFIYEQSIINNYPFDFMLSIISTETRDEFNSHGEEAYNKSCNNYDLGYTQQNSQWSLPVFQKKFDLKYEDAYYLLQYDDYANVYAAFLEFEEIDKRHKNFDAYEYAGCYNGWLDWQKKESAREYVYKYFMPAYDEKYNEHHEIEDVKKIETNKTKKK